MSDTQHDDDDTFDVAMSLTMHDQNEITVVQMLGLKPTAVVEFGLNEDGSTLRLKVDVYGVGTAKEDVINVGTMFELVAESIATKAADAYEAATVEATDG